MFNIYSKHNYFIFKPLLLSVNFSYRGCLVFLKKNPEYWWRAYEHYIHYIKVKVNKQIDIIILIKNCIG